MGFVDADGFAFIGVQCKKSHVKVSPGILIYMFYCMAFPASVRVARCLLLENSNQYTPFLYCHGEFPPLLAS